MADPRILVVIPARGGSKGIPRKNLRVLNGHPLLYYAVKTALASRFDPDVVVTSDDDEILAFARIFGVLPLKRAESLSGDAVTLDPVVHDAHQRVKELTGKDYDFVVTLQPTSPLLRPETLDQAITRVVQLELDTLISATDDTHLMWEVDGGGGFVPRYQERLNRQQLPMILKETGGFLICRAAVVSSSTRIGPRVQLHLLQGGEEIDIDTFEDWAICEFLMKRKTIAFVVAGSRRVGMSHVNRALLLAGSILDHEIVFVTGPDSAGAHQVFRDHSYNAVAAEDVVKAVAELRPDLVINDVLDTTSGYMEALRRSGARSLNFEDMGEGALLADAVVNDMYHDARRERYPHIRTGPEYFCLGDAFKYVQKREIQRDLRTVLVAFGGMDPGNHTLRVLSAIAEHARSQSIEVVVVLGLGYDKRESLRDLEGRYTNIRIVEGAPELYGYMSTADVVFSAGGRTTFEIASIGTPAIVMPQNQRERSNVLAHSRNGFVVLAEAECASEQAILARFIEVAPYQVRREMARLMRCWDFSGGKQRVLDLIRELMTPPEGA